MAPYTNITLLPHKNSTLVANTSDVIKFPTPITVSGFYGPGPWTAWAISLITSWIAIGRNDYSNNFHLMGWLLYTNWAAVDMIRQLVSFLGLDHIPWYPYRTIGVAFPIVHTSVLHILGQWCICGKRESVASVRDKKHFRLRRCIIIAGSFIPVAAMIAGPVVMFAELPPLKFFVFRPVYIVLVFFVWGSRDIRMGVLIYLFLNARDFFANATGFAKYQAWSCQFYPCWSQTTLGEWDQAFTLFFALFFFCHDFYHYVPGIVKRCVKIMYETEWRQLMWQSLLLPWTTWTKLRWVMSWPVYRFPNQALTSGFPADGGVQADPSTPEVPTDDGGQATDFVQLEAPQPAHLAPEDDSLA